MSFITTYLGRRVDLVHPDPAEIDIRDIAHSLSQMCRFSGHSRVHYSVAQHSVLVSRCCPPHLRLRALLHDAAEAYLNDWPTPIKELMPKDVRDWHQLRLDRR